MTEVSATMMAAFLYLGAGVGLLIYGWIAGEKEKLSGRLVMAILLVTVASITLSFEGEGLFSGFGGLLIALVIGETIPGVYLILFVMLLGFVAYGLSINFYIKA